MNRFTYQALKIAIGTVVAIAIATMIGLNYATTAGVIALLSVLDSRKQTYYVGIKRIVIAFVAIILASVVFGFAGHTLWALGIFLLIFVPCLTWLNSTEGLSISTVLVTHIYTINELNTQVVLNEMGLMVIGVLIAFIMNLHMLNMESDIKLAQKETEALIKEVLVKMSHQLLNQCSIKEQENVLDRLNEISKKGLNEAITYDNNYFLKDYSYYAHYFRMRRQQYFLLMSMERYFKELFMSIDEAKALSDFTFKAAEALNEYNDGYGALAELNLLKEQYREMPLPTTRESFEDRATLFAYMNDLAYFIQIKSAFMIKYGEIKYCD